ncbi:hypothetical protein ONR75_11485 [Rhodopseudomonas sp. P2A-2r]|uniref:hypothetical protein n=1 Tax=Rhodopseudomonas sp. P2A-2r TaxID=2991972 RepID=UPI002234C33F|nr:hypothetical protein [Rhodopseudomonas sp. P2A-2r]UZE51177.1 hypothetical protein ONR75_11485 [Rhodopseudomonas sp. P2A-2r]
MTTDLSSAQVIARFTLRMIILCVFASLGSVGFARSFAALLWMSAIVCMLTALLRREPLRSATLSYWDEAAIYGALFCLACLAAPQVS